MFNFNKLFLIIFFILFLQSCAEREFTISKKNQLELNDLSFNAVEKEIYYSNELPSSLKNLINNWFEKKIKLNGYDGTLVIEIKNFKENATSTQNKKTYNLSLEYELTLKQNNNTESFLLNGKINSFGNIDGLFSLDEFDVLKNNVQLDLFERLVENIKSKT